MRKLNSYTPSLIVLGTAIVVLLAGPSAVWHLTYAQTRARIIQASEALDNNPILEQLSQAYRDVVTLVEPSVVHISTERTISNRLGPDRLIGSSGSGWVYDDAGYIVTNYHVIEDADPAGDLRLLILGYHLGGEHVGHVPLLHLGKADHQRIVE